MCVSFFHLLFFFFGVVRRDKGEEGRGRTNCFEAGVYNEFDNWVVIPR